MLHLKLTIMALLWAGGFIVGKNITDQAGPFIEFSSTGAFIIGAMTRLNNTLPTALTM